MGCQCCEQALFAKASRSLKLIYILILFVFVGKFCICYHNFQCVRHSANRSCVSEQKGYGDTQISMFYLNLSMQMLGHLMKPFEEG